jgi:hypothetical protein
MKFARQVLGVAALLLAALVLAACDDDGQEPEPLPDPHTLLGEAAAHIETAASFELEMDVDGYPVVIDPDGLEMPEELPLQFKYAHGVYQAPDRVNALVQFSVGAFNTTAELIAVDRDHYFRGDLLTANQWINAELIEGFSPAALMSPQTGIPGALDSISGLELVGRTDVDGVPMFHVAGTIQASAVHSLTFGLIRSQEGELGIEVFITADDTRIAKITLTEPPPDGADEAEPTVWVINFTDYDEEVSISAPSLDGSE